MFLTNNYLDLYALTYALCSEKDNFVLAWFPGISAIRIKIIDVITSRLLPVFPGIPENFRKY